jgi:hypothetical protein
MKTPRLGRQSREILARLLNGDRLTSKDAALEMSCWRLAARCFDLRSLGWNVRATTIHTEDGTRFAEYSINPDNPRLEDRQQRLFDGESAS